MEDMVYVWEQEESRGLTTLYTPDYKFDIIIPL